MDGSGAGETEPEAGAGPSALHGLRALAHPTRLRMYGLLAGASASAAMLARELEVEHASASYHLRVLRDAGVVELVAERDVNGGVERLHRLAQGRRAPTDGPPPSGPASTADDWTALVAAMAALLQARARRVAPAPKWFDDLDAWVPEEALIRARHGLDEVFERLRTCALPDGTDGAHRVSVSAVLFELAPRDGDG